MRNILQSARQFLSDEQGLTVIEYVIGAALLVSGLVIMFGSLGSDLDAKLDAATSSIGN